MNAFRAARRSAEQHSDGCEQNSYCCQVVNGGGMRTSEESICLFGPAAFRTDVGHIIVFCVSAVLWAHA